MITAPRSRPAPPDAGTLRLAIEGLSREGGRIALMAICI